MKRRTFLQISGMTAASALISGCQSTNEKLIPYLIPPDEGITPGKAVYYASSCRSCPAGCGILVRVSEGRAKKIEGNPEHPVNRGKLCARGQALLQELYHPDRVPQPLKRSGPRGSGQFTRISWEEGLNLLTAQLKGLERDGASERLALMTPQLRGTLATLAATFMSSFGSPHHLSYELLAPDALRAANRASFGQPSLPWYDIAQTRYLLSFGAEFVDQHLSPVHYGNAFGRMRQERDTVRGHFTYVGGRLSLTAASADRWMPARPGSEGALALGLVRLILSESLHDRGALSANGLSSAHLLAGLGAYDLPRVAKLTGLSREAIAEVAREFATTRPSLAMAGEGVAFLSNGPETLRAIGLLNLVTGNLNSPGGVYPDGSFPDGPENSFADLVSLVGAMAGGRIALALIEGDPLHRVPAATGFPEALAKVPYVVSFSQIMDDTALQADLILPDHAQLESWGDVIPVAGGRLPLTGLMQPVVTPVFDTRQFPDVLLAAAAALGGKTARALPFPSYQELVKKSVLKRAARVKGEDDEEIWSSLLQKGGDFREGPGQPKGYRWAPGASLPAPQAPLFAGDEKSFPLHLQVYPSTAFLDGRGAPLPWLQQLPDPMSTVVWDSWVELNPKTAAGLGIAHGDLVEVSSPQGSLRLPAVVYPGIRPDLVAIPIGQGMRGGGRYAKGRGANPLSLLAAKLEGAGPTPCWSATRVKLVRISGDGGLVTNGNPQGSYRSDLVGI